MPAVLMENPVDPNIATCPTCGTLIDVADQEPYAKIHCSSCGTWMRVRQSFANFEITGILREGGQGLVYRAVDKKLNRNVAIKLMRRQYSDDPIFVKRFESEARVTAGLNHPNIVKVFSFGEHRGLLYLAMEMVDQGSLDAVMQQLGKVPEDRVLEVGGQIARGLQAGLEKGLIHRDIKPGNILFADEHTAKIVDFGLAVLVEKQHEEEGEVWATPFYVAPEKLEGGTEDFHSDMYSLAATLFHALAGRPPFIAETNSMSELKKIKSKPVHLLSYAPHVSNATAYVIEKALAVRPEDRFASYAEFIENLDYARNELRKRPKARTRPLVATTSSGTGGSWITILAILMVVAVGLVVYLKYTGAAKATTDTGGQQPNTPSQAQEADEARVAYNEARFKLIKGKYRLAAAGFREVYGTGKLPEPTQSWCAFHDGMAELLDGRSVPAKAAFAALERNIAERGGSMDPQAAGFFKKFAGLANGKETVAVADAEGFNRKNYEAVALLALGLKNWEAGAHTDAVTLLRQFQAAEPEGTSAWVGEYRPLVTPYLEEHGLFAAVVEDLSKWETKPERAEAALAKLPELKEKIHTMGLRADLRRLEEELAPKVVAALAGVKEAKEKKMADLEAADEKVLTDAKLRIKALCETYQFRDALNLIKATDVKSEKHVADRELLIHRVEWLVQFKEQLIRDLTAFGYAGSLMRKNNTALPGGVAAATETHLSIRIGAGSAMVQWNELTPASVLAMAKSFFKPTLPPETLATRQWLAGVFCIFTELYNESGILMGEAATVNEEYRIHKALFFGKPAEEAPAPKPAPSANAAPATPAPAPDAATSAPGTGLEMLNDSLNPTKRNPDELTIKGLRRPPQ